MPLSAQDKENKQILRETFRSISVDMEVSVRFGRSHRWQTLFLWMERN
jgi:hypothetical protein